MESGSATRKILWLSFLIAIVIYGVVGYLVFAQGGGRMAVPGWLWPLLAVGAAVAAFVVPPRISDALPGPDAFLRPAEVVGWALAETVAILGLLSVALGGPRQPLIAYLVVAAVILW